MCANKNNSTKNKIKIVNTKSLNFRKEPSTDYEIIRSLPQKSEVEVVPMKDGWTLVRYNGTLGFVSTKYLSNKSTNFIKKYVNVRSLNFRSDPSTKYSIIEVLLKDTGVEEISMNNGWSKIKYNGKDGYVES
ncbi:SH3 domain-containing protein [Terrisporobacter sp.]